MAVNNEVKRLKADGNLDYDAFTTLVGQLLRAAWGDKWGTYSSESPVGGDPNNVSTPVITYSLREMVIGKVGKNTMEMRARVREQIRQEVNGNAPAIIEVRGQLYDAQVVFECWEESNSKVEKLAKRFRDFMNIYSPYFMQQGLGHINFVLMNDKPEDTKMQDNLRCRKFVYFVKFEELTEIPTDILKTIEVAERMRHKE